MKNNNADSAGELQLELQLEFLSYCCDRDLWPVVGTCWKGGLEQNESSPLCIRPCMSTLRNHLIART